MQRIKNWSFVLVIIFVTLFGIVLFTNGYSNSKVLAASENESNIYSPEQYTDDDFLLKSDGKPSLKTIDDFASEVQEGKEGDYFPELAEVIPR